MNIDAKTLNKILAIRIQSFPKTVLSPDYRWRRGGSEHVSNFSQGYTGQVDPILTNVPRALLPGHWEETGFLFFFFFFLIFIFNLF